MNSTDTTSKTPDKAVVISTVPFCADDKRFSGAAEVVEIPLDQGRKTIGLRLRVGTRFVHIPRHRTDEVMSALRKGAADASNKYQDLIREMNEP